MKNIHIKTSVLFLVILDGLPTDWLVFNVFKFFKSFHLIYIIIMMMMMMMMIIIIVIIIIIIITTTIIIIVIIKQKKQKTKAKRKQN